MINYERTWKKQDEKCLEEVEDRMKNQKEILELKTLCEVRETSHKRPPILLFCLCEMSRIGRCMEREYVNHFLGLRMMVGGNVAVGVR